MSEDFDHMQLDRRFEEQRAVQERQHRKRLVVLSGLAVVLVVAVVAAVVLVAGANSADNSPMGEAANEIAVPEQVSKGAAAQGEKSVDAETATTTDTKLEAALAEIGDASPAKLGIYVAAADGSWEATYNADRAQVSASMIKMAIMGALFQRIDAGELSLADTHTVQSDEIVGGTGAIQNNGAGGTYTLRELVRLMISNSDNTATNIIIDMIGMDAVNAYAAGQGLTATQLNRKMMDTDAAEENYTSARDLGVMFRQIAQGTFAGKKLNKLALKALAAQTDDFGFAQGLPSAVTFAHKTGSLAGVRNDGGITRGAENEVVMVLLTADSNEGEAQSIATEVDGLVESRMKK